MAPQIAPALSPIRWSGDHHGWLELLDQTQLPGAIQWLECQSVEQVWDAIKQLRVRGAPAIGIAAAYGLVVGLQDFEDLPLPDFIKQLDQMAEYLGSSRPTAVNLFWALQRMQQAAQGVPASTKSAELLVRLLAEARAIHDEDRQMCRAIGRHGAELIADGANVLTHCNAGGLATAEYGTALSVIFTAQDQGKQLHVFVDETRPLLQGARLTAWELMQRAVPCTLICDSMAAQVMREGRVQAVITGADRIAANGDSANKIGTYGLAVLARAHGIPFYIAAPSTTFDLKLESGAGIPIEQRSAEEITQGLGRLTAPAGVRVYNPAFDVTPAELIHSIITERGLIHPVTTDQVRRVIGG
ncbi:MAG: S-methyl-5-thioribose-1-phosphate isomerase [Pirellulales bacterium]